MLDLAVMLAVFIGIAAAVLSITRLVAARAWRGRLRWLVVTVGLLLSAGLTGYAVMRVTSSRTWQMTSEIVPRVATDSPLIALTFDDGPMHVFTEEVLRVLADRNVKATFFLMGTDISTHAVQARAIAAAGHEIGNHTYSHPRMVGKPMHEIASEIERTDQLIRSTGYTGPIQFRPPFGKKLLALPLYLSRHNRRSITWDIEPDSYEDVNATSEGIVKHTLERAKPGSIILLHVMYRSRTTSLQAVGPLVDSLHARGFRFVTVSELLSAAGGPGTRVPR